MNYLLLFLWAMMCSTRLEAQKPPLLPPGEVKAWRFPVKDGELVFTLFSFTDSAGSRTSISITTSGAEADPTVKEESAYLENVVAAMPSLGCDPLTLKSIHMGILEKDTVNRLKLKASESQDWLKCSHTKGCNGASIVFKLLEALQAYDTFNEGLAKFGLKMKLTYIEDVIAEPAPDPRVTKGQLHPKKLILPVVALMEFSVSRILVSGN